MALATCLGGVWSLEQPSGALTEYYPAFRETIKHIFSCGGPTAVGAPFYTLHQTVQITNPNQLNQWASLTIPLLDLLLVGLRCNASVGGWGISEAQHRKDTMHTATHR